MRSHPPASNVSGASSVRRITAVSAPRTCAGATSSGSARRSAMSREQMKRAAAICERSTDCGEAAVGTDQALLHRRVAARAIDDRAGASPSSAGCSSPKLSMHRQQHRVDDEAVVVVPVERRAVAVGAVALVPLLVLPQRVVDARAIPVGAEALQPGFDRRREQQPVVEAGQDRPRRLERGDELPLHGGVERIAQRAWRPQQAMREERGVDQRLSIAW